ncbi:MAG: hypothetical protein AABX11_03515 [Nanoarchaeota archaeon]
MKIDPYKNKEKYTAWKERLQDGILNISKENSNIILNYLEDMENGANIAVGSPKGSRGYPRLNSLKARMIFFAQQFEKRKNLQNIANLTEDLIKCSIFVFGLGLVEFFMNILSFLIKARNKAFQ